MIIIIIIVIIMLLLLLLLLNIKQYKTLEQHVDVSVYADKHEQRWRMLLFSMAFNCSVTRMSHVAYCFCCMTIIVDVNEDIS